MYIYITCMYTHMQVYTHTHIYQTKGANRFPPLLPRLQLQGVATQLERERLYANLQCTGPRDPGGIHGSEVPIVAIF